jgi:hypothetical protein
VVCLIQSLISANSNVTVDSNAGAKAPNLCQAKQSYSVPHLSFLCVHSGMFASPLLASLKNGAMHGRGGDFEGGVRGGNN